MAGKNVMDGMFQVGEPSEAQFLDILFTKDYRKLKMVHEVQPDLVFPTAVLGLVQRVFKSSRLKILDEEHMLRVKSKDRKGIGELVEWAMSMRRPTEEGEY